MLLSAEAAWLLMDTLGLMCLLAASYGTVARASRAPWLFCWVMGALFGVAAVLALRNPMQISEGVQGDLRGVPIVLAGAYLGWQGALAAASFAIAMRLGIGGAGMLPGCMGILINVATGLGWAWLTRKPCCRGSQRTKLGAKVGLAVLSSTYLLTGLLLPPDTAWRLITTLWPNLLPLHMVGIVIVAMVLEREQTLLDAQRRLTEEASRDPLTRLLNRRGFEAAVERVRPEFTGSALLLLDLDRFKRVNDVHGHAAGDAVLRELGWRLTQALQGRGVVGRLGGEEIAVFLPSILRPEAARVAERLRAVVRTRPFELPDGVGLHITASIGGACCLAMTGTNNLDALLVRADVELYAAKHGGRDRCYIDSRPAVSSVVTKLAATEYVAAPQRSRSRALPVRTFSSIQQRAWGNSQRLGS